MVMFKTSKAPVTLGLRPGYDLPATDSVVRRMGSDLNTRNISKCYSVSEQSIGGTTGRNVARPIARLIVRPLTIWNSRFQVLNITIDLVATGLPIAITHDICD